METRPNFRLLLTKMHKAASQFIFSFAMVQLLSFGTNTQEWDGVEMDAGAVVSGTTPLLAAPCDTCVLVTLESNSLDPNPTSIPSAFPFCLPIYSSDTLLVAKVTSGMRPGWVDAWPPDVEFADVDLDDLAALQATFQDMSKRDALRSVFGSSRDTVQTEDDFDDAEDERAGGINELLDDAASEDGDVSEDDGVDGDDIDNPGVDDPDNEDLDDDAAVPIEEENDGDDDDVDIEDVIFGAEDDDDDDDDVNNDEK